MRRRGFALIAVLWTLTSLSAVLMLTAETLKTGQRATRNRLLLERGHWAAESCAAIAMARWASLGARDGEPVDLGRATRCTWSFDDPGRRLNLNLASPEALATLLEFHGLEPARGRAIAELLVQMRAARPFDDLGPVLRIEDLPASVATDLTLEGDGRISIAASPEVLATLPGMTREAIEVARQRARDGRSFGSLAELMETVSPAARASLANHNSELSALLRFDTPTLLLLAEGWVEAGDGSPRAAVELRVGVQPQRLSVLRRRLW